jgi:hypothetical protein
MIQASQERTGASWNSMIRQGIKSYSRTLVAVLLWAASPVVPAEIYDITELQQPDTSSSAMTGFYAVTPNGKTTPEDPLESGFATSAGSDFDPERSAVEETESPPEGNDSDQATDTKKKKPESRTIRIRIKPNQPKRNLADQFQCERHGLYYTNDGRCIVPAFGYYTQPLPHPRTGPGMAPMDARSKVKSSR